MWHAHSIEEGIQCLLRKSEQEEPVGDLEG